MSDYQIGTERHQPEPPDPRVGAGERFTGADPARREEAAEEYAESARRAADKDTKD